MARKKTTTTSKRRVPTKQEIQKELIQLKKAYTVLEKKYEEAIYRYNVAATEIAELNQAYTDKVDKVLKKPFWTRRSLRKVLLANTAK